MTYEVSYLNSRGKPIRTVKLTAFLGLKTLAMLKRTAELIGAKKYVIIIKVEDA